MIPSVRVRSISRPAAGAAVLATKALHFGGRNGFFFLLVLSCACFSKQTALPVERTTAAARIESYLVTALPRLNVHDLPHGAYGWWRRGLQDVGDEEMGNLLACAVRLDPTSEN